jgi:hypothetical protein
MPASLLLHRRCPCRHSPEPASSAAALPATPMAMPASAAARAGASFTPSPTCATHTRGRRCRRRRMPGSAQLPLLTQQVAVGSRPGQQPEGTAGTAERSCLYSATCTQCRASGQVPDRCSLSKAAAGGNCARQVCAGPHRNNAAAAGCGDCHGYCLVLHGTARGLPGLLLPPAFSSFSAGSSRACTRDAGMPVAAPTAAAAAEASPVSMAAPTPMRRSMPTASAASGRTTSRALRKAGLEEERQKHLKA